MSSGVTEVELRPKSEWTTERALNWIFRRFQARNVSVEMVFLLHSLFDCLLFLVFRIDLNIIYEKKCNLVFHWTGARAP